MPDLGGLFRSRSYRDRALPRDLETMLMKFLERDPERRYPTAAGLSDDLARFLEGGSPSCATLWGSAFKINWWLDDPARFSAMRAKSESPGRPCTAQDIITTLLGASA